MITEAPGSSCTSSVPVRMEVLMHWAKSGLCPGRAGVPFRTGRYRSRSAPRTTTTSSHPPRIAASTARRKSGTPPCVSSSWGVPMRALAPAARMMAAILPLCVFVFPRFRDSAPVMDRPLAFTQETATPPGFDRLNLPDDGQGDLLRGLASDVEAQRPEDAAAVPVRHRDAIPPQFIEDLLGADPRTEHAEISGPGAQEAVQQITSVQVVVGHDYHVGPVVHGHAVGRGRGVGFDELPRPRESIPGEDAFSGINNDHPPPDLAGTLDDCNRIVSGTPGAEANRRPQYLHKRLDRTSRSRQAEDA